MFINPRVYYNHVDKTNNPRQERGNEIAKREGQIKRLDEFTYSVRSQSKHQNYNVIHTESGWTCECPDHIFRHVCCKHIHAVEISLKLREQVRKQNYTIIEEIISSNCPHCKSENYIKKGTRHNQAGDIQRYFCNDCSKWFILNLGFERMKATPKAISSAMQLYFTGESLRNVQKFLELQGVKVSHQTIYNWIQKYTKLMKKYLDTITPQVGDKWRADEVFVKVKGDLKYLFALIDDETRFWIAKEVANRKQGHDASGLFRQAKEIAQTNPRVIITDGLPSYDEAYKQEFWTRDSDTRPKHIRHIRLQGDMNNNLMERFNGEFRDREKVTRGIKKTDSIMFDGYQIYHNYIRPHMSLNNQTPADKAGIKIEGDNKWLTLIRRASLD
jgi:transposase-like protein